MNASTLAHEYAGGYEPPDSLIDDDRNHRSPGEEEERGTRTVDVREVLDAIDRTGGPPGAGYFLGPGRCSVCGGRWRPEPGERVCRSCKLRRDDQQHTITELRELREGLGLGQADLAQLLGLHPNTIAKWETGRQSCRMSKLVGLAVRSLRLVKAGLPKRAPTLSRHGKRIGRPPGPGVDPSYRPRRTKAT